MIDHRFDDMRPYEGAEIPAAMQRIAKNDYFPLLSSFVYPELKTDEARELIASYTTVKEFQANTMKRVNEQIIARSITEFSCSGLEKLDKDEAYLYVSNHRDIMLDSSLLQYFLLTHGFDTTEITFGANLMSSPLVVDIGKSNKMFKVERPGGSVKDFYRNSLHLSEYICHAIMDRNHSVWIAQRNGRTKNGLDKTDQGIIKMFCMSDADDKIRALTNLHIVPVAISYEWESCDILKTLELYESRNTKYTKKPGEDLTSILTGISQPKGKVHIEICNPILPFELKAMDGLIKNDYYKAVANLIDERICLAYRLTENNYIAHDLRYGSSNFSKFYTLEEKNKFQKKLEELDKYDTCDIDVLHDIFLAIYSNPVDQKLKYSSLNKTE